MPWSCHEGVVSPSCLLCFDLVTEQIMLCSLHFSLPGFACSSVHTPVLRCTSLCCDRLRDATTCNTVCCPLCTPDSSLDASRIYITERFRLQCYLPDILRAPVHSPQTTLQVRGLQTPKHCHDRRLACHVLRGKPNPAGWVSMIRSDDLHARGKSRHAVETSGTHSMLLCECPLAQMMANDHSGHCCL